MSERKCSMFLVEDTSQSWLGFYEGEVDKDAAKNNVKEVVEREKNTQTTQVSYIGVVDFSNMESTVMENLHYFEKYDPVWIINTVTPD